MTKSKTIWIELDGRKREVERTLYIKAKTKSLSEFGYSKLTEQEVSDALDLALQGKTSGNIIASFIESDLVK